jgi:hypothetical protein
MSRLILSSLIVLSLSLTACAPGQQFEIDVKEKPDVVIQPQTPPAPSTIQVK